MERRLIIDGNAVYEIDEKCMLKKHLKENEDRKRCRQDQKSDSKINLAE